MKHYNNREHAQAQKKKKKKKNPNLVNWKPTP